MGRQVGGNWEKCGGTVIRIYNRRKKNLFSIKHNNKIKLTQMVPPTWG